MSDKMITEDELEKYDDAEFDNEEFDDAGDFEEDEDFEEDGQILAEFEQSAEEYEEFFNGVLGAAAGRDTDGVPNCTASLAIDVVGAENVVETKANALIGEGELNFTYSGGCMVVIADFRKSATVEFESMIRVCQDFFDDDMAEKEKSISLTVFPKPLGGDFVILMSDLAYYVGLETENGKRLIMCFDNDSTEIVPVNIDFEKMLAEADAEDEAEYRELEQEFFELKKKQHELENSIYLDSIKRYATSGEDLLDGGADDRHNEQDEQGGDADDTSDKATRRGLRIVK